MILNLIFYMEYAVKRENVNAQFAADTQFPGRECQDFAKRSRATDESPCKAARPAPAEYMTPEAGTDFPRS